MSTEAKGGGSAGGSRTVVLLVAAVVVAAVVAAFGLGGFGSSSNDDSDGGDSGGNGTAEVQPVEVVGRALDPRPDSGDDPEIGSDAPGLVGRSFDGEAVVVEPGADGQPIMLVFLAHWCPHCNYEVPQLVAWRESGRVPANLRVVGIATAVDESRSNYPPSQWLADLDWGWPVLADSETSDSAAAYGLDGLPYLVVIDAQGKVALRLSGEKTADDVDIAVRSALGLS